ncbi:MAG: hypothetical protein IJ368_04970 [Oscillospiraceae bacterium]|nr:hypothetical protein [Oscillospiraceae bacterium]
MNIVKVNVSELATVRYITVYTINSMYPYYYPCGAVDFFLDHHNENNIMNDIENGNVYLCFNNDKKRWVQLQ